MKHRAAMVLDHLLLGHSICVEDAMYALSDDHTFCMRALDQNNQEHWLAVNFGDFTLQNFVSFCRKISEEEWISICGGAALRTISRRK